MRESGYRLLSGSLASI